jgi:hypothetical protein
MTGKISWWIAPKSKDGHVTNRGYGFLEVRREHGILEKFFCLGTRLLFDIEPTPGMVVEFNVSQDKPRRDNGYPLAENVKLVVVEKGSEAVQS